MSSGVPERVLGLHFFNPAPVMPLVEVVATPDTSSAVVDARIAFVEGLGKDAHRQRRLARLHRQPGQSAVHPGGPADARGG